MPGMISVIVTLACGIAGGLVANLIVRGGNNGRGGNVVLGLAGAAVGAAAAAVLGLRVGSGSFGMAVPSFLGATVLLTGVHVALPRDDRHPRLAAAKGNGLSKTIETRTA